MAKAKKIISLPEVRSYIVQPNRITNAVYSYTLYQERIFTAIVFYLQEAINHSMQGKDYEQLELFADRKEETIKLYIPLKEISTPHHYKQVRLALTAMAGVVLQIPFLKEGKKWIEITNFLDAEVPEKGDYKAVMIIKIKKSVAKMLVDIEKNQNKQPINYTRFIYQIAQQAKNKYTARLYKIISSWKKKGGFTISLDVLKQELGVENKYSEYKDFKRRVILPAFEELFERSDCWFNCKAKDFEIREGQAVTHLNFRVITPEFAEMEDKRTDYIRSLVRDHFKFNEQDMTALERILENEQNDRTQILSKIMQIAEAIAKDSSILYLNTYALKALTNQFN